MRPNKFTKIVTAVFKKKTKTHEVNGYLQDNLAQNFVVVMWYTAKRFLLLNLQCVHIDSENTQPSRQTECPMAEIDPFELEYTKCVFLIKF